MRRSEIVKEMRSWVGVPWRHQGRNKFGVDCAGLPEIIGRENGLITGPTWDNYPRVPQENKLIEVVQTVAREKCFSKWKPGDFVVMRDLEELWPMHMAMLFDYPVRPGLIAVVHAAARKGKVIEHRMPHTWPGKIAACFEYYGLED